MYCIKFYQKVYKIEMPLFRFKVGNDKKLSFTLKSNEF